MQGFAIPLGLLGSGAEGGDRKAPVVPQPEAALETLRERLVALDDRCRLRRGDAVVWKHGWSMIADEEWAKLPMLVEALGDDLNKYPPRTAETHKLAERVDMVLMVLVPGGDAKLVWCDSRMVEPWNPEGA